MTTVIKTSFVCAAGIAAMMYISACNSESSSDNTATTVAPANADKTADANVDKPAPAKKKGKATVMLSKTNGLKVEKDKNGIYTNAEVMPEYPGGEVALSNFVENNIEYPQNAVDANTEGTVNVSFVVDEKGKVVEPMTIGNNPGNGLGDEAVKIVNKFPEWKPGTVKGKAVKTRLTLPITFKLAES
ncbi:MAG: energy transducer TonB [Agriterribacter sp.]